MNLKKMERHLRVNLLGPGPRLMKKRIHRGRGLTKVEKRCFRLLQGTWIGVLDLYTFVLIDSLRMALRFRNT